MNKNHHLIKTLIAILVFTTAFAEQSRGIGPSGKITNETKSIEHAYPGEVHVIRNLNERSKVAFYEIRLFVSKLVSVGGASGLQEVVLVILDPEGNQLVSVPICIHVSSYLPNRGRRYLSIEFSVHETLEKTAVINLGRNIGLRNAFSQYTLPRRSIPTIETSNESQ